MNGEEPKREIFEKIIDGIRKDPENGLRLFYETYFNVLRSAAAGVFHSKDMIDEVVDDVLIQIWKTADKIESVSCPENWLYTIARRRALDKVKRKPHLPLEENLPDRKDGVDDFVSNDSFLFMLRPLDEDARRLMTLRFIAGYTLQEIADELERPLSTVSAIYYRSLDKIKEKLKK